MVVGDFSMPTMTTTEDVVVKKKLRIKFGTRKFEKECVTGEIKSGRTVPVDDEWGQSAALKEKSESVESESYQVPSVGVKFEDSVNLRGTGSKMHAPLELKEGLKEKRRKIDRIISHQCSNVLKKLINHKSGWPFLAPVDPVQLGIPDYFSVIKHPMDLGTVKSKLGTNKYNAVDEFAADVRLTFSNAMTYNPPGNFVHAMAKELNEIFNRMWKSVEKKLGQDQITEKSMKLTIGFKSSDSTPKIYFKAPAHQGIVISKSIVPPSETNKFKRPLEVDLPISKVESPTKVARSTSLKGTTVGDKTSSDFTLSKSPLSSAVTKCASCANYSCRCDAVNECSSGKSSRQDILIENYITHEDGNLTAKPVCQRSNSDPESDEWQTTASEVPLSPKRALRAALLKSRFAGTILKAQQKKLLDHGDKVDALKIQQQKEILERKQREERIRLEAEIKAAEIAERKKAEAERQAEREKEREAARLALQKMEKTVEFHETVGALKDIEMLCACPLILDAADEVGSEIVSHAYKKVNSFGSYSNPLEQLGLFMKDDYICGNEYDEEDGDLSMELNVEEGEITHL